MFTAVFRETLKRTWRNRKNRLVLILSLLGIFAYLLLYLPGTEHPTTIDREGLVLELSAEYGMKESRLQQGDIAVNSFTGTNTYSLAKENYENYYTFDSAIDNGDIRLLVDLITSPRLMPPMAGDAERMNSDFGSDMHLANYETAVMNTELRAIAEEENLTLHLYDQKTAAQQLHLFLKTNGPLILLLVTIFVASEILVDDRKHRTLKAGQPFGWWRYIFYQSISLFAILITAFAVLLSLFYLVAGILYGFGSFGLGVSSYAYQEGYRGEVVNFSTRVIGSFVAMSVVFILLLVYLFVRLNAWLSLLFRHDVVVMIIGFLIVGFNRIYSGGGEATIFGIGGQYFPQNYFEFGQVLSGERNFLALNNGFTFGTGVMVLAASIVILEVLLLLTVKWMNRQKFEREVG
ncbi:hypothetical protein ACFOLA_04540 [Salinicoccus hispanicus]|uniref:ABC transporter permease n=1 Tax=Salinicoccus hispanicus TaxID=157225 RepID=A0A6N8U1Y6_9STAP|nr:hypothetical protein [Salinicoccus hispanicus]MXQ52084.1 hypothetical protein [Salinicoccus hispanicus]